MDSNTEETAREVAAEQAEISPVTSLEELADRLRLALAETQMHVSKNDVQIDQAHVAGNAYRAMVGTINRTIFLSREGALADVMQMITGEPYSRPIEDFPTFG